MLVSFFPVLIGRVSLGFYKQTYSQLSFKYNTFSYCISFFLPPHLQIEISRRVTLEELPPVLVLHLKRFVFEKTGGCQKLTKNIDYPVDLEISKGTNGYISVLYSVN